MRNDRRSLHGRLIYPNHAHAIQRKAHLAFEPMVHHLANDKAAPIARVRFTATAVALYPDIRCCQSKAMIPAPSRW